MACQISVRDIDFHASTKGVRIRAWTDAPAHLYLRLSPKHPWIHKKPSIRRGVAFAEDVRFCFTVFEDNEQHESGDTLQHTWWQPAWPVCTTKWLYVWGSRAGETCVSTTAPFSYHNDGIAPIPPPEILRTFNSIQPQLISHGTPNVWQNRNLAQMISPDATGVLLHVLRKPAPGWCRWGVGKPGAAGLITSESQENQTFWGIAGVDADLNVSLFTRYNNNFDFWLMGYFNDNVVWLDSFPNLANVPLRTWTAVDVSSYAPGAIAGIFVAGSVPTTGYGYGLRPHGSTNNWIGDCYAHYSICKIVDGKVDFYNNMPSYWWYEAFSIVGYIKENGLFHTNAQLVDPSVLTTWETHTLTGLHDHPTLAILEWIGTTGWPTHGERKWESYRALVRKSNRHIWPMIHPDDSKRIDLYRTDTSQHIYLHGTLD